MLFDPRIRGLHRHLVRRLSTLVRQSDQLPTLSLIAGHFEATPLPADYSPPHREGAKNGECHGQSGGNGCGGGGVYG